MEGHRGTGRHIGTRGKRDGETTFLEGPQMDGRDPIPMRETIEGLEGPLRDERPQKDWRDHRGMTDHRGTGVTTEGRVAIEGLE